MTDRNIIQDLLIKHQIRKSKKEKEAFRSFLTPIAEKLGYKVEVEENGSAKNVVVGDPETARVIYTAHYDTPACTPFPNLMIPKNKPLYILYQTAVVLMLYSVPLLITTLGSWLAYTLTQSEILEKAVLMFGYALIWGVVALLLFGPANKHNANDNTSGVMTLIKLMEAMPEADRSKVAFVFFDLEERGCVGSKEYSKAHKSKLESTPVINFDCVGVGNTILLAPRKGAHHLADKLGEAFVGNDSFSTEVALKSTYSNSDHKNFNQGVGVAALSASKRGILYTGKIHTKRDTECHEENIDFLVACAVKLAEII